MKKKVDENRIYALYNSIFPKNDLSDISQLFFLIGGISIIGFRRIIISNPIINIDTLFSFENIMDLNRWADVFMQESTISFLYLTTAIICVAGYLCTWRNKIKLSHYLIIGTIILFFLADSIFMKILIIMVGYNKVYKPYTQNKKMSQKMKKEGDSEIICLGILVISFVLSFRILKFYFGV